MPGCPAPGCVPAYKTLIKRSLRTEKGPTKKLLINFANYLFADLHQLIADWIPDQNDGCVNQPIETQLLYRCRERAKKSAT